MDPTTEALEIIHESPEIIESVIVAPELAAESPWTLGLLIFSLTFIIEELAVAASVYFVGSGRMTFSFAFIFLYLGVFISDFFLYAIGVFIRRNRWTRKHMDIPFYQTQTGAWLKRGLTLAVIAARLVPGLLIPIFIMFGFSGMSLRRLALINAAVTGVYSFVALFLLYRLGVSFSDLLEVEVFLIATILFLIYVFKFEIWMFLKVRWRLLFSPPAEPWPEDTHKGMPALKQPRKLSFFENLPYWLVYSPIWLCYFFNVLRFRSLSAPVTVNPAIENSGLCGESKTQILNALERESRAYLPKFISFKAMPSLTEQDLESAMVNGNLSFPLIAKPDVGYMSRGVCLVTDMANLLEYLENFPPDQIVILQEYLSEDAEAGIYYACHPSTPEKFKIHVALTYFPFVVGNGRQSVNELLRDDPRFAHFLTEFELNGLGESVPVKGRVVRLKISGSTRDGSMHVDWPVAADSMLGKAVHQIAKGMPGFWLGRFDVKFKNLGSLERAEFKILELNGASGEDLSAWDARRSLKFCYGRLFGQMRDLFSIGVYNKKHGVSSVSGFKLLKAYLEQESMLFRIARATRRARKRYVHSASTSGDIFPQA